MAWYSRFLPSKGDTRAVNEVDSAEKRSLFDNPAVPLRSAISSHFQSGMATDSGVVVSPRIALQLAIVQACIKAIAGRLASLEYSVWKKTTDGVEKIADHRVCKIVDEPAEWMTHHVWLETKLSHALLWGNGYTCIDAADPKRTRLVLLSPDATELMVRDGKVIYRTILNNKQDFLEAYQVLHLKGLSHNGFTGLSPVHEGARTLGKAIAAEMFAARFFKNNCQISGVLTYPGKLKAQAVDNLKKGFKGDHSGAENAHDIAVLQEGLKWTPTSTDPEKSQLLESMKYYDRQIASQLFRVPPSLIGLETQGDAAQEALNFLKYTLSDWVQRTEQEISVKLFTEAEKAEGLFFRFDVDSLLRADQIQRYEANAIAIEHGWKSINDIRAEDHLPPIEGGDSYLQPLNMVAVDQIKNLPEVAQPEPEKNPNTPKSKFDDERGKYQADCERRVNTKEQKAVQRAAKKFQEKQDLEGFKSWAKEFFKTNETTTRQTMSPVLADAELDDYVANRTKGRLQEIALACFADDPWAAIQTFTQQDK